MRKAGFIWLLFVLFVNAVHAQSNAVDHRQPVNTTSNFHFPNYDQLFKEFQHPPESAKPWVFWYWMQASVSKAGITADLEAMKYAGIAGAYLMPIKDSANPPLMQPVTRQLTPEWWAMMKFAFEEAERLGLKLAMHVSDGFALAGGPWITPELSMQKLVWSKQFVDGGVLFNDTLPIPPLKENYYRDIAVYAYPSLVDEDKSTKNIQPVVTTSNGMDAGFLTAKNNQQNFSSADPCWIQYKFEKPFTCRSIIIRTNGNNYQAQRLRIEVSEDEIQFKSIGQLKPPRHGWQDVSEDVTHAIAPVTAKYFRFIYNNDGSEPGAEDLDAAKWKQSLKIKGIELSGAPVINQYESKNGSIWRLSEVTTKEQVNDVSCISLNKLLNVTNYLDEKGHLNWQVPPGKWTIIRMGHTSTGLTNATGGGGKGLECDKFNPEAITLQFNGWFGEAVRQAGPALAAKLLSTFHVDSWECGSQNWSPVFREEFKKRRGYDIRPWLPVMAGIPLESAGASEKFLHDVRQTIADLVADNFYGTLSGLAKQKGCRFTAESVAPTMMSDGMMHYKQVDIPMGEFWLRSPTHDKPNDMLDAISGAHIYGKPIIQAEAFTELRMAWNEHPGMLKALQDRNYALGINKLVYHVFMHNPWTDRKPGMTLDGIGLYFQRDQTWWKPGKEWVSYAQRCQALLQAGRPVADIAVFTGEELPRRSLLPDRLVNTLPGIFGEEKVAKEKERLANRGTPLRELPAGVRHSANIADPGDWTDPLQGYAYDCFNPDALMKARVVNREIVFEGGARYRMLVLPQTNAMMPSNKAMSLPVLKKIFELASAGATILLNNEPEQTNSLGGNNNLNEFNSWVLKTWHPQAGPTLMAGKDKMVTGKIGKGIVLHGPYKANSFDALGIAKDLLMKNEDGSRATGMAWTHRTAPGMEIYFISNQKDSSRVVELSLRCSGKLPELWDAVSGLQAEAGEWKMQNGRTILPVTLPANGSVFLVLAKNTALSKRIPAAKELIAGKMTTLDHGWQVQFDSTVGGPSKPMWFDNLTDWSQHADTSIKYYSGTALYTISFEWKTASNAQAVWLDLGSIANLASIKLNGKDCGVLWTPPFKMDISNAIKPGSNLLEIEVTNTWANRLIGDQRLPVDKRITKTNASIRLSEKDLQPAGLMGPVVIRVGR